MPFEKLLVRARDLCPVGGVAPLLMAAIVCAAVACGDPDPKDLPSCDGIDTTGLTCENAAERAESAPFAAEVLCFHDYHEACGGD